MNFTWGDSLLAWISHERYGSITRLRSKVAWLARSRDLSLPDSHTGRWVRAMSALGHLEADWDADRWMITPPTISMIPGADGLAIVSGALSPSALAHSEIEPVLQTRPRHGDDFDAFLPQLRMVQTNELEELQAGCAAAGFMWAGYGAMNVASRLPKLSLSRPAVPPARDAPLEFLKSTRRWLSAPRHDFERENGLYRTSLGQRKFYYREGGHWWHTELAEGRALSMRNAQEPLVCWRPELSRGREMFGSLLVDDRLILPPLHERAAVLSSGVLPLRNGTQTIYANVSSRVSRQIADSLDQHLHALKPGMERTA